MKSLISDTSYVEILASLLNYNEVIISFLQEMMGRVYD